MRRGLAAAAILVLLLALIPAAAAAPTAPSPTAADPTSIQAVTPTTIVEGIQTTLVVTLRDTATAAPVGGANLTFAQRTTFGWLPLGTATTNAQGEAGITYEPAYNGTYTLVISYAGDGTYAPTNTTLALTVVGTSAAPPPLLTADRLIVLVIVAVVGGVWATYGFVAFLVLGIRRAGARPDEEESESTEKESMEADESEAERPKQRVPGVANTNRAVVYLAISALVLSGAAVVLLLSGGVTHSAAYTPSTVDLQVTVVPDFRGAAYDSFVPDELVVHAGDTVKITVFNEDTMDHGFAIDALGVNSVIPAAQANATGDITPSITLITFTVTGPGAYLWYCTNPCGPGHTTMTGTLMVLPDD